jgi:N-acetyl-anhydromuramyl-L-alanine amidase AmpD
MAAWHDHIREPRQGILLHYDGSASDDGAVYWMTKDPRCRVSYQWLVLDDGEPVRIAPDTARAFHAGVCRPSGPPFSYHDANSALYGLAVAATDGEVVTQAQKGTVLRLIVEYFQEHGWPLNQTWRVTGHEDECWPRHRKHDPTGSDPTRPVLSVAEIRTYLAGAR